MKAVKWVATNVLSKDELHNVLVEYDKDKQSPTVTVHLYAAFPEKEVKEQHCKCCEEMHHSFFINENNIKVVFSDATEEQLRYTFPQETKQNPV